MKDKGHEVKGKVLRYTRLKQPEGYRQPKQSFNQKKYKGTPAHRFKYFMFRIVKHTKKINQPSRP